MTKKHKGFDGDKTLKAIKPAALSEQDAQRMEQLKGDVLRTIAWPKDFDHEKNPYGAGQIMAAAADAHEANRAYCQSIGDDSQANWADAPDWQRQSAFDGVCFAIAKGFPDGAALHVNWCNQKYADGWHYGPDKDAGLKTHPCLVPYEDLPAAQKKKDGIFRDTVMATLGVAPRTEKDRPPTEQADGVRETGDDQASQEASPGAAERSRDGEEMESQEDRQMLSDLAGEVLDDHDATAPPLATARHIWCFATFMAADYLIDPDDDGYIAIAECLASFYLANPEAPGNAAEIEVKRRLDIELLPDVKPERRLLAVTIFKTALLGRDRIEQAETDAALDRVAAATLHPPHKEDLAFQPDKGREELSSLGKAAKARET